MSEKKDSLLNRRGFIQRTVVSSAAAAAVITQTRAGNDRVPDGPLLKVGVVGCGGRGTGAAVNAVQSAPNIQIVALGDVFQDRVEASRKRLEERGHSVPASSCFVGFDAYRRVIQSDVDYVILAAPPHFRPLHFAAIVEAGRHAFIEKPVAVDPAGIREMFELAGKSEEKGLCVVAGTQRRHQNEYLETYQRIADGAIGKIVASRGYWNQGALWHRTPQPEWTEMEYMIRDWVNWSWLSGDHIVEQHVHQIDVIHWFTGMNPTQAVGMGGRMRRATGDQFDLFAIDFEHPDGTHLHSMCRQINGCENNISEFLIGTRGSTNCKDTIFDLDGKVVWSYQGEKVDPYVQEHTHLVRAIRTGQRLNEARQVTESTLTAIMARISAYTGRMVTRDQVLQMTLRLGPSQYAWGPVDVSKAVPAPGAPAGEPRPV